MRTKKAILLLMSILLIATMVACKSTTVSDDHDDEHAEAEGLTIRANGVEIVRIEEGVVTGSIEVQEGDETVLLIMNFLDHDGDEFTPEEDEFSLGYHVDDESIAEVEHHDEDGKWNFHIVGLAQGATEVTLELLHGDHPDFESPPIPITVTQ